jgi:hypothetical protein
MNRDALAALIRSCLAGSVELEKGLESNCLLGGESWNDHGVRDPVLLTDPDGVPIADTDGRLTLFFNGRDRWIDAGGVTQVGRAFGRPEHWIPDSRPVFSAGAYAAAGSAVRIRPDLFRLYYSADTLQGFHVAISPDGASWRPDSRNPILVPSMFGAKRIGLPYVCRVAETWRMVFEGSKSGVFAIFMAQSDDGLVWYPSNGGKPIYSGAKYAWDGGGQANPSLYALREPSSGFVILYNGHGGDGHWEVGLLYADRIEGPWGARDAPLLRRGAAGTWDAGRVEGARPVPFGHGEIGLVYFGLPTLDSCAGGRIGFARFIGRSFAAS